MRFSTFPAIVIEGKNRTAAAGQVGDQETQVGTGSAVFSFVDDAPLMRPGVRAIAEAGKGALRLAAATITPGQTTLQGLRCSSQPCVVAYTDGVLQTEKLAKFIKQWRGETCVGT